MAEFNIFAWSMEVEDEVFASDHGVEVQAGDVFFDLFLFYIGCGLGHEFWVEFERALGLEQGCVDGEVHFIGSCCLVAVEEWW